MAAKKKPTPKPVKGFTDRLLKGSKVLRILTEMGASARDFQKRYEADNTRGPRSLTNEVFEAVEAFQRSGDLDALKEALGTENNGTALAMVGRVVQQRAQQ